MKMCKKRSVLTALLAGMMLCAGALPGCGAAQVNAPQNGGLYINEIVSSNAYSLVDPDLGTPDWIELYNGTTAAIRLQNYGLSDNIDRPYKWRFPDVAIQPGEYLMVYASSPVNTDTQKNAVCTGYRISSLGETLVLTDPYGALVQDVTIPELPTDISWGRDAQGNYCYFSQPTPQGENGAQGAYRIEDVALSSAGGAIRINELMTNDKSFLADEDGDSSAWVELYNTSSQTQPLQGFYLTDSASNSTKWQFPDVSLAPGGYLIVFLSGKDRAAPDGELHTNFTLSSRENGLWLVSPSGTLEDRIQWQAEPPQDFSLGRDGQGDVKYYGAPTPGGPNAGEGFETIDYGVMGSGGVRINEFLVDNKYSKMDADGDRSAWVEIYNAGAQAVSLKHYALSTDPDDPVKWRFPDVSIASGQYLLVFLSGKDRRETELHTGFTLTQSDAALVLTDLEAMESDCVMLPETLLPNVSYGRAKEDADQWAFYAQPTPLLENTTKGFEDIQQVSMIDGDGVWISEVCAVDRAKSGKLDWIEIANGGAKTVSLSGYYLSDDVDEPCKWKIPSVSVAAGGFAVIYASAEPSQQKESVAAFGVSASGEELVLSDPGGTVLDVFETGALRTDVTSGRAAGDYTGRRVFFTAASPGRANSGETLSAYAAQPAFSRPGGYAGGTVSLTITCETPGAAIYYTLDGSKPTSASRVYTGTLTLKDTTVVKAAACADGLLQSDMTVATYLFEEEHTVPVVCLSGNQSDINRVYSVTDRTNIEREAYIEYYEADGTLGVQFPAGIRVGGASTRTAPQKMLNLYLRGGYGQSEVTYPFFEDFDNVTFESLTLRNSGQDRWFARIRDAYCAMACRDMNVDYAESKLVVVYINGRYWGLYNLRENQNEDYYAYRFDTTADNVERIRRNQTVLSGSRSEILAVRAFARSKNMADDAVFAEFCEKVDADAFMDYIIAQTFFGNADMFNQKFSRAIDYTFKWRPVLYDLDLAMYNPSRNIIGSYFRESGVPSKDGSLTNMDIQCALLRNPGWKEAFIERYAYHLNNTFAPEKLLALFEQMVDELEPEMARHIARWGYPKSMSAWKNDIDEIRDFLTVRTKNVKKHLQSYFHLSDARMAELFPNG